MASLTYAVFCGVEDLALVLPGVVFSQSLLADHGHEADLAYGENIRGRRVLQETFTCHGLLRLLGVAAVFIRRFALGLQLLVGLLLRHNFRMTTNHHTLCFLFLEEANCHRFFFSLTGEEEVW